MSHRRKDDHDKKLRRRKSCGKTEIDGEAWLSDEPLKWDMYYEEEEVEKEEGVSVSEPVSVLFGMMWSAVPGASPM
jgi:hypothetical protein